MKDPRTMLVKVLLHLNHEKVQLMDQAEKLDEMIAFLTAQVQRMEDDENVAEPDEDDESPMAEMARLFRHFADQMGGDDDDED